MASLDQLKDQSMNRRMYDGCKTGDDLRVTTGPGKYQLEAPASYCDACFAPEPTVRQQRWGASLNQSFIKTDVESDLFNINRPTTKTACNQYNPDANSMNAAPKQAVKECSFPQTFSRLVDPPCTGRSTGWNRWEWLCQNPQEAVMVPFDNQVTTRLQKRDQHRPCIPKPQAPDALLPAPLPSDNGSMYDDGESKQLEALVGSLGGAFNEYSPQFPAGEKGVEGVYLGSSIHLAPY
jgi:hypothetical protein